MRMKLPKMLCGGCTKHPPPPPFFNSEGLRWITENVVLQKARFLQRHGGSYTQCREHIPSTTPHRNLLHAEVSVSVSVSSPAGTGGTSSGARGLGLASVSGSEMTAAAACPSFCTILSASCTGHCAQAQEPDGTSRLRDRKQQKPPRGAGSSGAEAPPGSRSAVFLVSFRDNRFPSLTNSDRKNTHLATVFTRVYVRLRMRPNLRRSVGGRELPDA